MRASSTRSASASSAFSCHWRASSVACISLRWVFRTDDLDATFERLQASDAEVPVFATIASRFNDPGVNQMFAAICAALSRGEGGAAHWLPTNAGPMEHAARELAP